MVYLGFELPTFVANPVTPSPCFIYRFYWAQGRQGPQRSAWTAGTPRPSRKSRRSGSARTEGLSR